MRVQTNHRIGSNASVLNGALPVLPYPVRQSFESRNLLDGFRRQAKLQPHAPALLVNGHTFSYRQLDEAARTYATALRDHLPQAPQRIAIFAYKSDVAYTATLAALYTGAAFVPLNRHFPAERTRMMLQLAKCDAVIADEASAPQLAAILEGLERKPVVVLPKSDRFDFPLPGDCDVLDQSDLTIDADPAETFSPGRGEIAYLLFTSGSTGLPKGVPITHANVLAFLATNQRRYRISPNDRLSQTFDQTFDLSVFDLFMAWTHGACLVVLQRMDLLSPFRAIAEHGITIWFSVPSVAVMLMRQRLLQPNSLPGLRLSLFCGEALPQTVAEQWQAAAPHSVVENLYGPTELTICCAAYRWDAVSSSAQCHNGVVPIGEMYEGMTATLFDGEGRPVADGEIGELCVTGPQMFPGYYERPDLSEKAFLDHLTDSGEVVRYYRTGDLVRRDPQAGLIYLGRRDRQVKVAGYRIELGDVEGALKHCDGIEEVAVVAWPIKNSVAEGLIAFVAGSGLRSEAVQKAIALRVPAYMCPREIVVMENFPLNANGKVDYRALTESLEARARLPKGDAQLDVNRRKKTSRVLPKARAKSGRRPAGTRSPANAR